MRSSSRLAAPLTALLVPAVLAACGDGATSSPVDAADASMDASAPWDGGELPPRDAGPRPDASARDAGFDDERTVIEGVQVIEGLRTYVRVDGTLTSTLPPVVVLHDGPALAHEYLPDPLGFLAEGRTVVYYDMRATGRTSFGSSTMTTTLTADLHVMDVGGIVDWIGTQRSGAEHVDLVGHGYGAAIAALWAAANPARVERLVLVTPYPLTAMQLADYTAEAQSRLTTTERSLINRLLMEPDCWGNINMCTIEIWGFSGAHYVCPGHEPQFRSLRFEFGDYRTKDFVEVDLRNRRYDWRPTLASITAETTVISGPCDPIPEVVSQDYAASISGASHVVFSDSGRFPMVEEPDAFARVIRAALHR
ncbi:alpha/beta hydrolase [Myxococcota bacterium]|nr:alpha/beta hydrolase [Myxococcota bacterium]